MVWKSSSFLTCDLWRKLFALWHFALRWNWSWLSWKLFEVFYNIFLLIYKWLSNLIDKSLQKRYALVRMNASFTSKPFYFDKIKELLFTSDHMRVYGGPCRSWGSFMECFKGVMSWVLLETCGALSLSPGLHSRAIQVQINTEKWEEQETISMQMGQIQIAPPSITCTNIIKLQAASTKYNLHLHRCWSLPLNYA